MDASGTSVKQTVQPSPVRLNTTGSEGDGNDGAADDGANTPEESQPVSPSEGTASDDDSELESDMAALSAVTEAIANTPRWGI